MYFDSIEEAAMVAISLEPQAITPPRANTSYPEVDRLVFRQLAQSASLIP
jgi:hypothetical protein